MNYLYFPVQKYYNSKYEHCSLVIFILVLYESYEMYVNWVHLQYNSKRKTQQIIKSNGLLPPTIIIMNISHNGNWKKIVFA